MALDLATVQVRTARQDRLTEHRSSIVPERRDTRAPDFQGSARMGSAARGDVGGAEELMRTLGLANKAAGSFSDYANAKFQKNERDNAAQGSIDAATGHVDAELEARSASYKNSVALGRTMTGFQSSLQSFGDDLHGLIENQDDADLATRQTEVKDRIDKFFRDFALDPDTGQLRGFLATPEAKRWLAGSMTETRAKLEATSLSRIEERFKGEALTHASTILGTQIDAGNIDIAGLRKLIPATVSDDELRSTILTTFQGKAEALKADGRYEDAMRTVNSLLGEGTAPGTVQTIDIEPSTSAPGASPAPKGKPTPVPRSQRVSFDTLAGAVMHVESRGDAAAVSPKGARGKMQTMPGTLRDPGFGVKPAANDSPQELERVGRDYLRAMLGRYNGNYVHALAAYNAGPGNVDKWLKRNPRATDAQFVDAIPFAETRDYIAKVMTRAGAGTAGGVEASPDNLIDDPNFATDPEPLNPVDAARQSPGVSLTPQLTGGLTLRPEERTKLLEYRDQLGREVRAEWDRKIKDGQDEKYGEFLQRLSGLGAPITPTEIAEASKRREITPTQTRQLLETVRSDRDRADALAERADNEAERDRIKADEKTSDGIVASIMGPVYSGQRSPGEALRMFGTQAPTMSPEVRRRALAAITGEANAIEEVRKNNPQLRSDMDSLDDDEQNVLRVITNGVRNSKGKMITPEQQRAIISMEFAKAKRTLMQRAIDKGDIANLRKQLADGIKARIRIYTSGQAQRDSAKLPRPAPSY